MREVVLLMGNIGCGKSTLAKKYSDMGYAIIDQDSIREMLGCGKYMFDEKTEPAVKAASETLISELINTDLNFLIDGCLISRSKRKKILDIIDFYCNKTFKKIIVFPRYSRASSLERRMQNPRGISEEVWGNVWDKFDSKWQHPTHKEGFHVIQNLPKMEGCRGRRVRAMHTCCKG